MSPSSADADATPSTAATDGTAVRVQYFATLREEAGQSEEALQTEAATVAGLYEELAARHGFSVPAEDLRVAVNDDFADWETSLDTNDLVVFIPPVAGG
jgi:molybdopterin converting factor subunit 1